MRILGLEVGRGIEYNGRSGEIIGVADDGKYKVRMLSGRRKISVLRCNLVHMDSREAPPSEYVCPITQELMHNPVLAEDGHLYEKKAISEWLSHHLSSPKTNGKMGRILTPCYPMKALILDWTERHPHYTEADVIVTA